MRTNFTPATKRKARERANHTCQHPECNESAHEVDHIKADWRGGEATLSNAQVLCAAHHKIKTAEEAADRAKADRQSGRKGQYARRERRGYGLIQGRGFQQGNFKRKVSGRVVVREG